MSRNLVRCLLLGALTMPLLAHAQIYKWIDQQGVTSYGQKTDNDRAYMYAPPANTHLDALGNKAEMTSGPLWAAIAYNFSLVEATANATGTQTKTIGVIDYVLSLVGPWI